MAMTSCDHDGGGNRGQLCGQPVVNVVVNTVVNVVVNTVVNVVVNAVVNTVSSSLLRLVTVV
jgi:hypothetical protein